MKQDFAKHAFSLIHWRRSSSNSLGERNSSELTPGWNGRDSSQNRLCNDNQTLQLSIIQEFVFNVYLFFSFISGK